MKTGYSHISVLVDRSGSMASIKDDMEGGYKTFLDDQKGQSGEATLELRQFDTVYEQVHEPMPVQDAPYLVLTPRGSTALLDAMGLSITQTKEWVNALPEDEQPEQVIFTCITDGHENASREWDKARVKALVEEQTKAGWTFIYLGANQDAIQAGQDMGISAQTSMDYLVTNTSQTYDNLSRSVSSARLAGASAAAFTDEERKSSGE